MVKPRYVPSANPASVKYSPGVKKTEARDLIRGMLQHDPSKRLSIREILTHPWFKMTIVDKVYPNGDVPSIPPSPNATSPTAAGDDFFAESALKQQQPQQQQHSRLTPHVAGPSPLSTHLPTTPRQDSGSSETENGDSRDRHAHNMPRLNSAEFSTTEKELEQLHPSSTSRPTAAAATGGSGSGSGAISPRSVSSPSMRGKTLRTLPEDQVDVDNGDAPPALPLIDEHHHLPVALHSRTPSRTKRRSVSSTLSLERRLSHHSSYGSYITFPPEDYLSKLDPSLLPTTTSVPDTSSVSTSTSAARSFTTPSETRLLRQLDDLGLDVGQLKHSVETDACDASAGLWWLLRQKQEERGETDEVVVRREKEVLRREEKVAEYAREERRKARDAEREREREKSNKMGILGIRPGKLGSAEKSSEGLRFKEEQAASSPSIHAIPSYTSVIDLGPPVLPVEPDSSRDALTEEAGGDGREGMKRGTVVEMKSWGKPVESPEGGVIIPRALGDKRESGGDIELATFSQSSLDPTSGTAAASGGGGGGGGGPKTPKKEDGRDRSPRSSHSRDRDRNTGNNNPATAATPMSNANSSTGAGASTVAKSQGSNANTNPNTNTNTNTNASRLKAKSPSMNMLQRATSVLGGVGKKGDDKDKDKDKDKNGNGEELAASVDSGTGGGASTAGKRGGSSSPNKLRKPVPAGMKGLTSTLSKSSESESEGVFTVGLGAGPGGGSVSVSGGGYSPAVSASGSKTVTPGSSPQRKGSTPQATPRGGLRDAKDTGERASGGSASGNGNGNDNDSGNGKGKGGKKDSLWTTFRHLFYEDRRRRKRQSVTPSSPSAPLLAPSDIKLPAGAVVLSRGANSRTSQFKRPNIGYAASTGSRRTSLDGNRPVYSRRSSSVHTNSRRSSVGSLHFQDHQAMISDLSRRTSQRSHGSQTPTSDREYFDYASASAAAAPISRPGSSHSIRGGGVGGGSRRSSFSVRSPSLNPETPSVSAGAGAGAGAGVPTSTRFKSSVPPASPLLGYRRRPAGGNDSSRVRHIKVIPESQIMRSSSVASSIRSNASSRASSMDRERDRDRESEYESGRDDVSLRSGKRQKKRNGSQRSLAQQIHRTRSPLALSLENTYSSSNSVANVGLGIGGASRNPKKPLRDVFQKKGKRKDGDDEWVSEDEDEFACGLGQGRGVARRFSNANVNANGTVWMNANAKSNPARSAAAFPTSKLVSQSTPQGGGSRRRERGRRSSLEEERGRPQEGKGKVKGETVAQGLMGMESLSGRSRRNLPDRSTAPGIIEEEEEDEE